jgi:phosphotriesterase-related protein
MQVETVRGPVDVSALGTTLMHEHVFVLTTEVQHNFPDEWGSEDDRVADAVAKLEAMKAVGVDSIVDPTVIGLGRYIPRIQRINEQVDVNIVVATGVYTYNEVPNFFRYRLPDFEPSGVDPMVGLFVKDITKGIAGTSVKAAFLKCAIDEEGMKPGVERVLRAVAKAHLETGAPITVHTHPGTKRGSEVAALLDDEGVAANRVVLGHSGDSDDVDHLAELAGAGYFLGMDRFGIDLVPFQQRVATVAELCRRGFANSMVLSHDASCYIDWIPPRVVESMSNWNYTHIHRDVLPALREQGVTDDQITTMLVDNPRRYFSGQV